MKRKVLEGKELTYYLIDDSSFVPQTSQFVYEILKSRGNFFSSIIFSCNTIEYCF